MQTKWGINSLQSYNNALCVSGLVLLMFFSAIRPSMTNVEIHDDALFSTQETMSVEHLKNIFSHEQIPESLIWIAQVESNFDPKAVSPAGAVGLFQFMPETASRFGLDVEGQDERLDPEKSAAAAAKYLKVLHDQFGSWELALAAYNAGEGRVSRLLIENNASTFQEIAYELPSETRQYVPKVLNAVHDNEGHHDLNLDSARI